MKYYKTFRNLLCIENGISTKQGRNMISHFLTTCWEYIPQECAHTHSECAWQQQQQQQLKKDPHSFIGQNGSWESPKISSFYTERVMVPVLVRKLCIASFLSRFVPPCTFSPCLWFCFLSQGDKALIICTNHITIVCFFFLNAYQL